MDMYLKIDTMEYIWDLDTKQIIYTGQAKSEAGHTTLVSGQVAFNGSPISAHNAIIADAEVQLETDHSITVGILDQRYLYGWNFTSILS